MKPTRIYPYSTPDGIRELVPLEDYEALKKEYAAELAHWKANHDNQVKIKADLTQRPDLGDRAPRVQKLIEENAAMREALNQQGYKLAGFEAEVAGLRAENEELREAIREAHAALDGCREDTCELFADRDWWKDEHRCDYSTRWEDMKSRISKADAALAKLQPYLNQ